MAIDGLTAVALIHIDRGLALLIVVSFSYDEIKGEDAPALLLTMRTVTDRDRSRLALQHVPHRPAQATTLPILHDVFSPTMIATGDN